MIVAHAIFIYLEMNVNTFVFNPFEENTYVVSDGQACIVIDPGCASPEECQALYDYIEKHGLTVNKIVLTHGHFDHFAGCQALKDRYHAPLGMAEADEPYIPQMIQSGVAFGFDIPSFPPLDFHLTQEQPLTFGQASLKILPTPGHSKGGVSFYAPTEGFLISGDTLFQGSIGRTDLVGGDYDQLMDSIEQQILVLPPETRIFPGHGLSSTVDDERLRNPFLMRLGK